MRIPLRMRGLYILLLMVPRRKYSEGVVFAPYVKIVGGDGGHIVPEIVLKRSVAELASYRQI